MKLTAAQVEILKQNIANARKGKRSTGKIPTAKGRPAHEWGKKNKTEQRFEDEILTPGFPEKYRAWFFEAFTLQLGHRLTYTPDYFAISPSGDITIYEVKGGYSHEDAIVKYKAAREKFCFFTWVFAEYKENKWIFNRI